MVLPLVTPPADLAALEAAEPALAALEAELISEGTPVMVLVTPGCSSDEQNKIIPPNAITMTPEFNNFLLYLKA